MKKENDNTERKTKIIESKGDFNISLHSINEVKHDISVEGGKIPVLRGITILLISMITHKLVSLDDLDAVYEIVNDNFKK